MQTAINLQGRDFLTLAEFTAAEIAYLLEEASKMKAMQKRGIPHQYLQGKVLGLIFEKSSTRTRVSFEVGMIQLGGQGIFLSTNDIQLGRGETIADTAKVLSRYLDGIMIRTFGHDKIEELAKAASIPVINGLSDDHHPCQVLADLLTIQEHKGKLAGLKLCFVGDGNNMANSLLEGAVLAGMHVAVATPPGYEPSAEVTQRMQQAATQASVTVEVTQDPVTAIKDADVVYTDVWASMGQEAEQQERLQKFQKYQVNQDLCSYAKGDYLFLHCLPAHRGEEVTGEILDGPHSVVFDQAENRLHAQKAILKVLLATG